MQAPPPPETGLACGDAPARALHSPSQEDGACTGRTPQLPGLRLCPARPQPAQPAASPAQGVETALG